MSTTISPPPPLPQSSSATVTRRVPPPCWTKEETLALIEAYKDKWFALRRGNLKASDWDAVSDAVSSASDPGTVKSSVQCRHKIEKLRKRYRAEKQRSLKILGSHHEVRGGYDSSFNFDDRLGSGYGVKRHENEDFVAKGIKKFKSNGRIGDGYGSMVDFDHSFAQDVDSLGEFPLKTLGDRSLLNVAFKPKNYGCPNLNYDYDNDSNDEEMVFRARDSGLGRKNASAGVKRVVDPVDEMVSSIKLLAEGFARMEKMKMETVKEIEKTRMEMEMKHNEMILESQQKIMDAFSNALLSEKKKRKQKQ
ncbi:hypothetical protein HRI_003712900 [Hibiscus trionum]|uniref:Myb-like domain-containing protein n=1 Tax=Hibiscus trionum TaxID=183268 RepID=A0A9W7ISQ0_HIBTR|nr:hypothetical protein HRI_003712900 [Hibiscus trionum]